MRLLILVPLLLATTAGAQVYKCAEGGKTTYSDTVCASATRQILNSQQLRGNTVARDRDAQSVQGNPLGNAARAENPAPIPSAGRSRGSDAAICPSEQDIQGLETKLSSIEFANGRKRQEREFLERELRRARACRTEGGAYTAEDLRRIKEAQDDQSNIRAKDRQAAREEALRVHASAASEREKQRMQADQQNDARRQEEQRARALDASRIVTSCDAGGCWDNQGTRYNGAGGTFFSSDGKTCTLVGTMLNCN